MRQVQPAGLTCTTIAALPGMPPPRACAPALRHISDQGRCLLPLLLLLLLICCPCSFSLLLLLLLLLVLAAGCGLTVLVVVACWLGPAADCAAAGSRTE